MKDTTDKINHLNLALRAIRSINRLISRTRDRNRLLSGICDILIHNRGYDKVWLAAFDAAGAIDVWAESDGRGGCSPLDERFRNGSMVGCAREALDEKKTVLILNPAVTCVDCPLSGRHEGWAAMTTPLQHEKIVYGLLSVSIPGELISEEIERTLVEEIASDIAYGLYRLQRDEEHRRADEALEARVRELDCLYRYSSIVGTPGIPLEKILSRAVHLLPEAMQFPENICAAIDLDGCRFETANFRVTEHCFQEPVQMECRSIGSVTVGSLLAVEDQGGSDLLSPEEKKLVRSLAERLGKTVERKRGRRELEDSEKRFRDLVENALTGISIIQDDKVVYRNPEYIRLFGAGDASLIHPDGTIRNLHREDAAAVRSVVGPFLAGRTRTVDLEFRIAPDDDRPAMANVTWLHGRFSRIEYRGAPAVMVYLMDVSRTKELEQLLKIQDKMTSLGRVAAGIAHEIRNPLSGINIYVKALGSSCSRGESAEKINAILAQIQSASNRIEAVIRRVMDFSRPGEPNFGIIDPNVPVEEAVQLSSVTLRKSGVAITLDLAPHLPRCRADQHMIEQVILNLISNATDAMKGTVCENRIHIESACVEGVVCIRVGDAGPGIPERLVDNIFDPFYTTKKNNSGIGLSICHRIISDHKGSLEVGTGHLGGAEFRIKLPPADRETS